MDTGDDSPRQLDIANTISIMFADRLNAVGGAVLLSEVRADPNTIDAITDTIITEVTCMRAALNEIGSFVVGGQVDAVPVPGSLKGVWDAWVQQVKDRRDAINTQIQADLQAAKRAQDKTQRRVTQLTDKIKLTEETAASTELDLEARITELTTQLAKQNAAGAKGGKTEEALRHALTDICLREGVTAGVHDSATDTCITAFAQLVEIHHLLVKDEAQTRPLSDILKTTVEHAKTASEELAALRATLNHYTARPRRAQRTIADAAAGAMASVDTPTQSRPTNRRQRESESGDEAELDSALPAQKARATRLDVASRVETMFVELTQFRQLHDTAETRIAEAEHTHSVRVKELEGTIKSLQTDVTKLQRTNADTNALMLEKSRAAAAELSRVDLVLRNNAVTSTDTERVQNVAAVVANNALLMQRVTELRTQITNAETTRENALKLARDTNIENGRLATALHDTEQRAATLDVSISTMEAGYDSAATATMTAAQQRYDGLQQQYTTEMAAAQVRVQELTLGIQAAQAEVASARQQVAGATQHAHDCAGREAAANVRLHTMTVAIQTFVGRLSVRFSAYGDVFAALRNPSDVAFSNAAAQLDKLALHINENEDRVATIDVLDRRIAAQLLDNGNLTSELHKRDAKILELERKLTEANNDASGYTLKFKKQDEQLLKLRTAAQEHGERAKECAKLTTELAAVTAARDALAIEKTQLSEQIKTQTSVYTKKEADIGKQRDEFVAARKALEASLQTATAERAKEATAHAAAAAVATSEFDILKAHNRRLAADHKTMTERLLEMQTEAREQASAHKKERDAFDRTATGRKIHGLERANSGLTNENQRLTTSNTQLQAAVVAARKAGGIEQTQKIHAEDERDKIARSFDAIRAACRRYIKPPADARFDDNDAVVEFVLESLDDSTAFHSVIKDHGFKTKREWAALVARASPGTLSSSSIATSTITSAPAGAAPPRNQTAVAAMRALLGRNAPVLPPAPSAQPPTTAASGARAAHSNRPARRARAAVAQAAQARVITRVVHINELVLNDRSSVGNIIHHVRVNPVVPTLTVTGERLKATDQVDDCVIMSINGQSVLYKTLDEVYRLWGECATDGFVTLEICTAANVINGYTHDDRVANSMVHGLFDAL